jgi:putative mRNA 3-end processing factor
MALVEMTEVGLYCSAGDFYVDSWLPVERAVITHSHSDHARPGSRHYLTASANVPLLQARIGPVEATGLPYGDSIDMNGVRVSLHPAGHILGSSQVRIEHHGEVWVVSGDYKTAPDPTCPAFEPLRCHGFVTEATFALPIYRWPSPRSVFEELDAWWAHNQTLGRTSVLFAYALGKSQHLLAGLLERRGPILAHGAVLRYLPVYEAAGVRLTPVEHATADSVKAAKGQALVLAPPSALGSPWLRKFGTVSTALASGWMRIRGARRRKSVDRGLILSDHADWDGLNTTIAATGATEVWATHGYTTTLARWLVGRGVDAKAVATKFEGDEAEEETQEETMNAE